MYSISVSQPGVGLLPSRVVQGMCSVMVYSFPGSQSPHTWIIQNPSPKKSLVKTHFVNGLWTPGQYLYVYKFIYIYMCANDILPSWLEFLCIWKLPKNKNI